jgi:hypothetical protein
VRQVDRDPRLLHLLGEPLEVLLVPAAEVAGDDLGDDRRELGGLAVGLAADVGGRGRGNSTSVSGELPAGQTFRA